VQGCPPPVDLRAVCWQITTEISHRFGHRENSGDYYLGASHMFLRVEVSEKTMFLLGGAGEGGGAGVGMGGLKGERETTICRLCSDGVSHARSTLNGRTDLRGFGCILCHSQPRKIDSGLTRKASTFHLTLRLHFSIFLVYRSVVF
jgi:hypothetical protein